MRCVDTATDLSRVLPRNSGVFKFLELPHFNLIQLPSPFLRLLVQFDPFLEKLSPGVQTLLLLTLHLLTDLGSKYSNSVTSDYWSYP